MIIISVGMPKSGSGYFYNIINALLVESGHKDARKIKAEYHLDDLLKWHNNFVGTLSLSKLIRLWLVSRKAGTFVVKSHAGPNLTVRFGSKLGLIRIIYCYRDPRDVLLSAMDHGKNIRASGDNRYFAKMVDFDIAMQILREWILVWERFARMSEVLMVKYEELLEEPMATMQTLEKFLGISISAEKRQEILWNFSKENPAANRTGMHLNKAQAYRYKTDMTREQIAKFLEMYQEKLLAMQYDIR